MSSEKVNFFLKIIMILLNFIPSSDLAGIKVNFEAICLLIFNGVFIGKKT